ncbi:MAG: hypothetical protein ABL961_06460 [Vicinamibacterales bacterium]
MSRGTLAKESSVNRRLSFTFFLLVLVFASASCQSQSVVRPDSSACFLGPMDLPRAQPSVADSPAVVCFTGRLGCPNPRPIGARTLVGLSTCTDGDVDPDSSVVVSGTGTTSASINTPCKPKALICPLIDPHGNSPLRYPIVRAGDACPAVVNVLLQASGDGGGGLEWQVQNYTLSGGKCVATGAPRVGGTSMPGPCCASHLEIPVPERGKTFRLIARTDWLAP